jgi:hypothetical protein
MVSLPVPASNLNRRLSAANSLAAIGFRADGRGSHRLRTDGRAHGGGCVGAGVAALPALGWLSAAALGPRLARCFWVAAWRLWGLPCGGFGAAWGCLGGLLSRGCGPSGSGPAAVLVGAAHERTARRAGARQCVDYQSRQLAAVLLFVDRRLLGVFDRSHAIVVSAIGDGERECGAGNKGFYNLAGGVERLSFIAGHHAFGVVRVWGRRVRRSDSRTQQVAIKDAPAAVPTRCAAALIFSIFPILPDQQIAGANDDRDPRIDSTQGPPPQNRNRQKICALVNRKSR